MRIFVVIIGFAFFWLTAFEWDAPIHRSYDAVDLGKALFFEPILSRDSSVSCASCHQPTFGFADSSALSIGVEGQLSTRNTPSIMNMAFRPYFFYDGRAATLEEQVIFPIENPFEMDLAYTEAVQRIQESSRYQDLFKDVYEVEPDSALILDAIASFIRSLESQGDAPHDVWLNDIDSTALTEAQIRGRNVFINKGKCFDCHFGPDFTGDEFRNIGLYDGQRLNDTGRFGITKDSTDLGKFKVPGLRNIALTAPYMHNGMFATLEEVVDYYDTPSKFVKNPINIDTLLQEPLGLTEQEKADLVAFMHSLTDPSIPYVD